MNISISKYKGVISLIVLAWVFATMGVFARYLGAEFELFEQTYMRIALAFVFGSLLFFRFIDWSKYFSVPKKELLILIGRAICLYLAVVLITEALLNTNYANASIVAVLPLMPVMAYFLLGETLKRTTLLAIGFGFTGMIIISMSSFESFNFGYGELMAFLSLILFNLSYIARKWQSDYFNNYEMTVGMFLVGAVFLFGTSVVIGEGLPSTGQFNTTIILALIGGGIFNVANLALANYGFKHTKASVASNILTLDAVFALAYGLFLFQEIPVLRELIGGMMIMVSVYFVNKIENQTEED